MNKTIIEPIPESYQQEDTRHSNAECWPDVGSHVPETDRHPAGDSSTNRKGLRAEVSPVPVLYN